MSLKSSELFSIEGKTALLTGAGGFLGRTMARALLENGARLIALGRSERFMDETAKWTDEFGAEWVHVVRVDMYENEQLENALRGVVKSERVDILVNNAHELNENTGFNVSEGSLEKGSFDVWMRNLTGSVCWPAITTKIIGTDMKSRGKGSIINISSMYALVAPSPLLYEETEFINPPAYSAAKAGMLALTRYTASFWGRYGVRANAMLPGPFSNTEDNGPNSVGDDDPFLRRLHDRTCLGRTGGAKELAGPLIFLSSDASSYMTGHALTVDGGWTII
ncbi:MAG: SDR family oxidoreductase [Nitrospinaceae bacterium]|nr:SDR family oxidoreductase [Nitrospinaceae bacterium]MBT4430725.1 SDR family oxidoreductase [Nitrospinaceae bacterium]MBT5367313.1 SDR family oxidoreductase [Nitrospinaceae bacterium]MBT6394909.1 SDR family oxidoreductase [Nitrospinaceae bacterium]